MYISILGLTFDKHKGKEYHPNKPDSDAQLHREGCGICHGRNSSLLAADIEGTIGYRKFHFAVPELQIFEVSVQPIMKWQYS